MEGTKTCTTCGEVKPLSEFVRKAQNKSGYSSQCLVCNRERCKAYARSGKLASHIKKDPIRWKLRSLVKQSKCRAKEAGIDHNIDLDYLREILPPRCPYLNVEFKWEVKINSGHNSPDPHSPSIDRIDSSKGYIKGNVAIVSHRANAIKNNASETELLDIARAVSLLKAELAFPG